MSIAAKAATSSAIVLVTSCFLVSVFIGIALAVILSLIPTYTSTQDVTPSGEKYCISDLRMLLTFSSTPYNTFTVPLSVNTSYLLSQACYRVLQNYKSDSLLSACLISNCSLLSNVAASPPAYASPNMTCYAVIYYSSRCPDEAVNSGLNSAINATGNSACRKKRMTNINGALGSSSSVQYTNVPNLIISATIVPLQPVYTLTFSNYSQAGAYYCGAVSRTAIASAVNGQATG